MADLSQLRLGTAPDSWGVWFPSDPHQVTWDVYLDEIARVGLRLHRAGPAGLHAPGPGAAQRGARPARPHRLRRHRLRRAAQGRGRPGAGEGGVRPGGRSCSPRSARSTSSTCPSSTPTSTPARPREGADIDPEQWKNLVTGTDELARFLLEEYGVKLVFHPHADTHVDTQERIERFLDDTDPALVNLCLDTGHVSYCDGDNIEIIERFPERITYVHLKSVDPVVRARVLAEKVPLAEAVKLGVMCEPPYGEPDMPPLLDALGRLDREIYTVIEQDLYPVEPHIPLPIGARTAGYYVGCGLGPVRRWPY